MTTPDEYDIDIADEIASVRQSKELLLPFDWFSRLWALAVIAHIIGNPRVGQVLGTPTALGVVTLATGATAVALVLRPDIRWLLQAMSVLVLLTVWFEAPVIGNHWLLAGIISIAILVSLSRGDSWNWFSTSARGIHLAFYAFAAFAKLNTSFFDPTVSCAVFYANHGLSAVGLPELPSTSALSTLVIFGTAIIELSIPVLLVVKRTRNVGVGLGLVFHTLISFDLGQHFYDFTAVLIPLFLLWARPSLPDRLGVRFPSLGNALAGGILGTYVLVSVLPLTRVTLSLLTDAIFLLWVPASIALVVFVIRGLGEPTDLGFRPADAAAAFLVGLVVLNGLTPYVELKTATSWNMYANLHTVGGESNHFIVRATLPLSLALSDPVEVLSTDDPGLAEYVESGYVLPRRTFYDYLADTPDGTSVMIREGGVPLTVEASDGVELNLLAEKFAALRAFDPEVPISCQAEWLPAH